MRLRHIALLVGSWTLGTAILWVAGVVTAVQDRDAPGSSPLARSLRWGEPWSFVDEALAHPRVTSSLGRDAEVAGWDEVDAGAGRLRVVARVRARARDGAWREGRLHVAASYYQGTVDDTAWGWQYPEVALETGDGAWSFAPPARLNSDPEGPRRW